MDTRVSDSDFLASQQRWLRPLVTRAFRMAAFENSRDWKAALVRYPPVVNDLVNNRCVLQHKHFEGGLMPTYLMQLTFQPVLEGCERLPRVRITVVSRSSAGPQVWKCPRKVHLRWGQLRRRNLVMWLLDCGNRSEKYLRSSLCFATNALIMLVRSLSPNGRDPRASYLVQLRQFSKISELPGKL